jgi:hypothetical protein
MKIIEEACVKNGPKAEIVVECSDLVKARSVDARNLALDYAKKIGLSLPGINGNVITEFVDEKGAALTGVSFAKGEAKACRATYPVQEATL